MFTLCKTWIVSLAVAAIAFMAVYDTVYLALKKQPVEATSFLQEPNPFKTEKDKEKEKEKETDELDEVFIEYLLLSVSSPVLSLYGNTKFCKCENWVPEYYFEIVPPPPRA